MGGRVFESPQAAVDALVDAARGRDRAELKQIFGPEVDRLATADKRQDDIDFQRFTGAYEAEHELVGRDGKYVLYVGSGDWWFPAPIVSAGNGWQFDTAAGVDEIINRTVGLNELHVIDSCGAYVRAQEEYFNLDPDGDGSPSYAQKLRSDPGRRNGLYWPDEEGAPMSPLGALVGTAGRAGDIDLEKSAQQPYRGYYFRVLTRQGAGAPGGQMDYVNEDGHMTRGFALIAWPASYGETGVMTFIVSKDGQVYQKDLGEDTDAEARGMAAFDPAGWSVVGDET